MFLVEGETDLMAMYSAEAMNTVAIWGVTSVKGVGEIMARRGVQRLTMICDNDDPGIKGAERVRDELEGIQFKALSIADYVGDKGDVGDMWRDTTNAKLFMIRLGTAPEAKLSRPKPKRQARKHVEQTDTGWEELRHMVEGALPIRSFKRSGTSHLFECVNPAHQDDTASADWHPKYGYHCFGCGKHKVQDVAGWLNIPWREVVYPLRPSAGGKPKASAPNLQPSEVAVLERLKNGGAI